MQLLSKLLALALAGAVTSAVAYPPSSKSGPDWKTFGSSPTYSVDIDMKSIKIIPKNGSWEIHSTIRTTFTEGIKLPEKTQLGAYSIGQSIVDCKADTFTLVQTTLYTKNGIALESLDVGVIPNPHLEDNFVTSFIAVMCNTAQEQGQSLTI